MKGVAVTSLHSRSGPVFPGHWQEVGLSLAGPDPLGGARSAAALKQAEVSSLPR